ncbi:unnamed protein product [Rangifer tarandus platyrhynchus]|uniref:Uncharacterized protein n=2 Tax=Rangifer tarandus platyrhynchus TaxID=3082113 RepID=A0ABN8YR15_RANTA|nr:unnamed protein product [Rangifer tarandus platyrhynchus]
MSWHTVVPEAAPSPGSTAQENPCSSEGLPHPTPTPTMELGLDLGSPAPTCHVHWPRESQGSQPSASKETKSFDFPGQKGLIGVDTAQQGSPDITQKRDNLIILECGGWGGTKGRAELKCGFVLYLTLNEFPSLTENASSHSDELRNPVSNDTVMSFQGKEGGGRRIEGRGTPGQKAGGGSPRKERKGWARCRMEREDQKLPPRRLTAALERRGEEGPALSWGRARAGLPPPSTAPREVVRWPCCGYDSAGTRETQVSAVETSPHVQERPSMGANQCSRRDRAETWGRFSLGTTCLVVPEQLGLTFRGAEPSGLGPSSLSNVTSLRSKGTPDPSIPPSSVSVGSEAGVRLYLRGGQSPYTFLIRERIGPPFPKRNGGRNVVGEHGDQDSFTGPTSGSHRRSALNMPCVRKSAIIASASSECPQDRFSGSALGSQAGFMGPPACSVEGSTRREGVHGASPGTHPLTHSWPSERQPVPRSPEPLEKLLGSEARAGPARSALSSPHQGWARRPGKGKRQAGRG